MKTILKVAIPVAAILMLLFLGCKKEASVTNGKQKVQVFLTDNPVNFQAVNIDIQKVEVKLEFDSAGVEHERWETLQIRPGVYNILNFRNGVDTLLAQGFVGKGELKKLRLTLGSRNSVVADNVTYPPLKKPEVIIDLDDISEINPSDFRIHIDFDASGSIIRINNNQFELEPRIRTFDDDHDGRIEGKVLPKDAKAIISVTGGGQTLVALPDDDDGGFKIRGIKASVADLVIDATANGYRDTIIKNINVSKEVKLGTITLRK
ncbi:MAG: DUF4382 domain-containing protein [Chitinophagaceae bacterium]|nr:DUF4382 domain-containing protein [Chitinophagaceae bacterium]